MKTAKLLFIVFFLTSITCYSQVTQEWIAKYNGPPGNKQDKATDMAVDSQGNVYVTGSSEGVSSSQDYATVKYNSSGVEQWTARYNGSGNSLDFANGIAVDALGNVYVTGQAMSGGNNRDFVTIKYNSTGVQQWEVKYSGFYADIAYDITVDAQGNVYVTGVSNGGTGSTGTFDDYMTIKYNSAGIQQWTAKYNGTENYNDVAYALAVDDAGNVYVTGVSGGAGTFSDYTTIKYNSSGVQQWAVRYDGPAHSSDIPNALALDAQGNVYVTGYSTDSISGKNYTTIKYNNTGVQQWLSVYNGPGNAVDIANAIAVDASGNVFVTGQSAGTGTSDDYATIKYNSTGVEQWVTRYNGPGNLADIPRDIKVDAFGNTYVTGGSDGSGTFRDYTTIRYNSSGAEQWVQRYAGSGNNGDVAVKVYVDGTGNVYITGQSIETGTSDDYVTIKYSQTIGIQNISVESPADYILKQNYPNPFNPSTSIEFAIPNPEKLILSVFNSTGQKLAELVNSDLKAGKYKYDWDASAFPSGIYFYKLETGSFKMTRKMLLIK